MEALIEAFADRDVGETLDDGDGALGVEALGRDGPGARAVRAGLADALTRFDIDPSALRIGQRRPRPRRLSPDRPTGAV